MIVERPEPSEMTVTVAAPTWRDATNSETASSVIAPFPLARLVRLVGRPMLAGRPARHKRDARRRAGLLHCRRRGRRVTGDGGEGGRWNGERSGGRAPMCRRW